MLISRQLQGIPDASAQPGGSMTVTRTEDGVTVGSALTDADGIATVQTNGSPGPVKTLFTKGNRWADDSRSIMPTGCMDLCDLRDYIRMLHSNGIILGYGSSFAITSSGSGNALIGTGAVVLDGVLSVHAAAETISIANGDIAIVVKQMHTNGRTQLVAIDYADLGSSTNVPLWRCTVSGGSISGTPTWIATPTLYNGIVQRHPTVMSIARATSGSTTNVSGEDGGLSTSITLETGIVYDITASASVITRARQGAIAVKIDGTLGTYQSNGGDRTAKLANASSKAAVTGAGATSVLVFDKSETALTDWVLQATYGPTFNGLTVSGGPVQIATDASSRLWLTDPANSRAVRIDADGTYSASITGKATIQGVAVDASGNVYLTYVSGTTGILEKFNSSLVSQWTATKAFDAFGFIAVDSTYVYVTTSSATIRKYNLSGTFQTSWGSTGSGNGQFNGLFGLASDGTYLYTSEYTNLRVQKFDAIGAYQTQWGTSGAGDGQFNFPSGIAVDGSGRIWVGDRTQARVQRFSNVGVYQTKITQYAPNGLAIGSGDVLWIGNSLDRVVAKWDEVASSFNWDSGSLVVRAVPRT